MSTVDRSSASGDRRIGGYVLPGDPVWLRSSLSKYYHLLEDLVVPVPRDGVGWTGKKLPAAECLALIRSIDSRGIMRIIEGNWVDHADPMRAETAQRQAAIDAIGHDVDWILQIDNDEVLPRAERLMGVLDEADRLGIDAVEWPMRVLFRRLPNGSFLEVSGSDGSSRYDYPAPIAIRPGARTVDARRTSGRFLRPVVVGDKTSLQICRPNEPDEVRAELLEPDDAMVHNSWGRRPAEIRRKTRTWGHASGTRGQLYYWFVWKPAPLTWRFMRDLHPFSRGLWPRLRPVNDVMDQLVHDDRMESKP